MKTIIVLLFFCSITFAQFNIYDLIVEYEQECFSDSTYELVFPVPNNNYSIYLLPYYAWVHKHPSWEGFREFVKRKYMKLVQP